MAFHYFKELLTDEYVSKLISEKNIIDGRYGGLLLGDPHEFGGIKFLYSFPEGLRVYGEVEGFEFIVNRDSAEIFRNLITEINNSERDKKEPFVEYDIPSYIKIINAKTDKLDSKYIILDRRGGYSIINKHSTKIYLKELNDINNY
ncbi:hypothetical protein [Polaribacter sp.]|uniref:hypothetical protein n=1 Tax=Polaribacter sp. TaxID=1920175 RepID=UPI0040478F60